MSLGYTVLLGYAMSLGYTVLLGYAPPHLATLCCSNTPGCMYQTVFGYIGHTLKKRK
uniref:Uncharacterized protein n=1 Tax=Anguilla anguilla TaxID=7936 RepID=A0A0E9RKN3_ANGAN